MSEIVGPQAGYALLNDNSRKTCLQKNRLTLLAFSLILFLVMFIVVYILTVGIHYKIVYPKNSSAKVLPLSWIERAIIYNSFNQTELNDNRVISKQKPRLSFIDRYKLVCYYSLSNDNSISGFLKPENVDPFLCTHINLCFAQIVNDTIYIENFRLDILKRFLTLKDVNKNLKILLSVGGAYNNDGFPRMVQNHQNRKKFIQSIDKLVREYKFDGIDIDWEFPNQNQDGDKRQKIHFMQLLQEIRHNINKQEKHKYLLSVAVAAPIFLVDNSYDVSYMNEYVDYVNLMSYDYHFYTKITPYTGINAPLYNSPDQIGYFATLNLNYSAYYWHFSGMEKSKIIVGLPTYGHTFTLMNLRNNGIGAPVSGYGKLGSNGFVDYKQICSFLIDNQIKPYFDMDSKSPYATKYSEWISYDDTTSLTFKAEFIKNNDFGGAMIYSLNMDDHRGKCQDAISKNSYREFPLTNTVKTILVDEQLR